MMWRWLANVAVPARALRSVPPSRRTLLAVKLEGLDLVFAAQRRRARQLEADIARLRSGDGGDWSVQRFGSVYPRRGADA